MKKNSLLYAITDIESTGGVKGSDKITEIAIYLFDGEQIIDEFHSLVNPERSIDPYVIKLTGITNEMVKDAPKFPEIARQIVEITEGAVFVAHNVSFDYLFLKREFKSLGYDYNRKRLCTVNLSRKIIPGHKSYSLGKLTKELGIGLNGRHRAAGDARATVELFKLLLQEDEEGVISYSKQSFQRKSKVDYDKLMEAPTEAGVYYLYNESNDLIYVGKSKNIHDRIFSHLSNRSTKKAIKMADEITDFSFELTGSDFMAELVECYEIKKFLPRYNVAQRRSKQNFGIFSKVNNEGYLELRVRKIQADEPLIGFSTEAEAKAYLAKKLKDFDLCLCLCGMNSRGKSCLTTQLGLCKGAGVLQETTELYNDRIRALLERIAYPMPNFVLKFEGRSVDEYGVLMVENSRLVGFGFLDIDQEISLESLSDTITHYQENRDVRRIIQKFLRQKNKYKIVKF